MFQGWITQLIDPVAGDAGRQWATLTLPVVLATLAVYGTRVIAPGEADARASVVELDRQRLGDRRFSSARLWFSAFAAQSAAALGIETHLEGDDVLDLELLTIQETMIGSTQSFRADEDHEALEWLTGHFRREMMDEAFESIDRPALSSCWIAFGSVSETATLVRSRGQIELRLVNASDLGQEAFVTMEWKGTRGRIGRIRRPLVGIVRTSDPALLGDAIARLPHSIDAVGDERHESSPSAVDHDEPGSSSLSQRLLAGTRTADVEGPLSDQFVSAAQAARLSITSTWGDHWWTSAPGLELGSRVSATVRCQLFTDAEPLPLRQAVVADRDSTGASTF